MSTNPLCKYRNIFGRPGTGIHSYRIGGLAAVDLLLTIAAAYFVHRLTRYSFLLVLLVFIVAGIGMHALFCVPTVGNTWLFSFLPFI